MKYSRLFGKTLKQTPKEAETVSHRFLLKAGFIDQLAAGIYSFLPLGWRVHQKIEAIIREEMNRIDGQEVFLPTLQPKSLWLATDRWDNMEPPLFKLKDQHNREYALGPTHEEVMTDLVQSRVSSYKELPFSLYQIQNKFRNEIRATGGLLRVREFMMKDLYSFHKSEKGLADYFDKVKLAYHKIFQRCGLKVVVCQAGAGTIGGSETLEFHVLSETGEDKIVFCSACGWGANFADTKAKKCPDCQKSLKEASSIEAGHIFKLGSKYSKAIKVEFVDEKGRKKPVLMGCYGIGLGRLMATIVEVHHDKQGMAWPEEVAPYQVYLLNVGAKKKADGIYEKLVEKKIEVLYDERDDVSAGEKFADADLIGIPVRLVVSEKTGEKIEWKQREQEKKELLTVEKVIEKLASFRS